MLGVVMLLVVIGDNAGIGVEDAVVTFCVIVDVVLVVGVGVNLPL